VNALQGKAIGVYPSPQLQFFVSRILPNCTIKTYNPDVPFIGLNTGDVVAVFVKEPFISIARTKPDKYRVLEVNSISQHVFGGALVPAALSVLSSEWIEAHPKEAAKFVRLARQAYLEYITKPDINMVLTEPRLGGFTPEIAAQVVEPAASFPEALSRADLRRYATLLEAGGLISTNLSFDKLLYVPPVIEMP
jgi:ABC-type nitrate/sulfonate/bicarbonate transport system substrate-binding protein